MYPVNLVSQLEPPFLVFASGDPDLWLKTTLRCVASDAVVVVRRLQGMKMRSHKGCMREFASAIQMEEDNWNWMALEDYIGDFFTDVKFDACLFIIECADSVLEECKDNMESLVVMAHEAGLECSEEVKKGGVADRDAKPFRIILCSDSKDFIAWVSGVAAEASVPVGSLETGRAR